MNHIWITCGSLYGIGCKEQKNGSIFLEDDDDDPLRWTIMRGQIHLTSSSLVWEKMHDVVVGS